MSKPTTAEYGAFYKGYIDKVPTGNLVEVMQTVHTATQQLLASIGEEKGDYAYADGKWTIKEVLQHMIDTEKVMAYRAMRIGRLDKTPLPGFDQDTYAEVADVSHRTVADLAAEFKAVRAATILQFKYKTDAMFQHIGTASNHPASARALGHIIVGHELHHRSILEERYL